MMEQVVIKHADIRPGDRCIAYRNAEGWGSSEWSYTKDHFAREYKANAWVMVERRGNWMFASMDGGLEGIRRVATYDQETLEWLVERPVQTDLVRLLGVEPKRGAR